jgi:hypothetical protein
VRNFAERVTLYFYSNANLWGSVAGFIGLGLLFGGVIERGWIFIVAGLYLSAAMLAPRARATGVELNERLGAAEIKARIDTLIRAVGGNAAPTTVAKIESVRDQMLELLPRLEANAGSADKDLFQLRETVFRYLPESVDAYLKLPRLYRQFHVVRDGKTAEVLFAEQITLLEKEVSEVGARIYQAEAQGLLAQGRFLDQKFRKNGDFQTVPTPGS